MTILLTGAAGFIGFNTCKALLARGEQIVGVDDLNDYYDPAIKHARLKQLEGPSFQFVEADIADRSAMDSLVAAHPEIDRIVHLAAQAGVRYSLENPHAYTRTNVKGQLVMLELARHLPALKNFVYASSSSVYGANEELPFAEEQRVDRPVSLYAATKRAGELMAHSYANLYGFPTMGLRYFTVYGPWGRPDMAYWIFTKKILSGQTIDVFNNGDMRRDFTFIDDIVAGTIGALDHPPSEDNLSVVYNLGNHRTEKLTDFIAVLEDAIGKKADINLMPMQMGDVKETYADISAAERDFGFSPKTEIGDGIPKFVEWFRRYHGNLDG